MARPLRIAQVAPLYESVPPQLYGGTERVVSYLTEELVRQGHKVTLYASADSVTAAELVAVRPRALRLDPTNCSPVVPHILQLEHLMRRAGEFDVIHLHGELLHFPSLRRGATPAVTTLHGRLDSDDLIPLFQEYAEARFVSISNAQRAPVPWLNWLATIHHGLPYDLYRPALERGRYLAFLGRISPEKRADRAIDIARRAGLPLKIAAKVDAADRRYFEDRIEPMLRDPGVEYIGEIGEKEKQEFLGNALALLFPIDWPEPFGLVMIEAMACGTPVIAYPNGSVPEVIDDGASGFVVSSIDEAVAAVERAAALDRRRCRRVFEERFTAERMAHDYLAVYDLVAADLAPTRVARTKLA
jgi:glycosyltransferase involved in cell wall biosynthesis